MIRQVSLSRICQMLTLLFTSECVLSGGKPWNFFGKKKRKTKNQISPTTTYLLQYCCLVVINRWENHKSLDHHYYMPRPLRNNARVFSENESVSFYLAIPLKTSNHSSVNNYPQTNRNTRTRARFSGEASRLHPSYCY